VVFDGRSYFIPEDLRVVININNLAQLEGLERLGIKGSLSAGRRLWCQNKEERQYELWNGKFTWSGNRKKGGGAVS
jgi:hypothetical protein